MRLSILILCSAIGAAFSISNNSTMSDTYSDLSVRKLKAPACNPSKKLYISGGSPGVTWFKAITLCQEQGKVLASIACKEEQDAAQSTAVEFGYGPLSGFWIGGMRTGSDINKDWSWLSSGTKFEFTYWRAGEPNNAGGNEMCVMEVADKDNNFSWLDNNWQAPSAVACEDIVS